MAWGNNWRIPSVEHVVELFKNTALKRSDNFYGYLKVFACVSKNGEKVIIPDASYWTSTPLGNSANSSVNVWNQNYYGVNVAGGRNEKKYYIHPVCEK